MADFTRDTLVKVGMDTQGAEAGFNRIDRAAQQTARRLQGYGSMLDSLHGREVRKPMDDVGNGLDNLSRKFKRSHTSNVEFLRVVQDAPFFFSSYQMGFMAISNNLPYYIERVKKAHDATGSWGKAIKATHLGMTPWLTVMNLVISGLLAYSLATREAKEDTEKLKSAIASIVDVKNPFENLSFKVPEAQLEATINQLKKNLENVSKTTSLQLDIAGGFTDAGVEPERIIEILKNQAELNASNLRLSESLREKAKANLEVIAGYEQRKKSITELVDVLEPELQKIKELNAAAKELENVGLQPTPKTQPKESRKLLFTDIDKENARALAKLREQAQKYEMERLAALKN